MTTKLLISGSREANPAMLDYARRSVERAHTLGWEIIVGDAAGIDQAVASRAAELDMAITIFGLGASPRNRVGGPTVVYRRVGVRTYSQRDMHMVAIADSVLCIWNGQSKGTYNVYQNAVARGLQAWLVTPQR
jgi:hypothetical protein